MFSSTISRLITAAATTVRATAILMKPFAMLRFGGTT